MLTWWTKNIHINTHNVNTFFSFFKGNNNSNIQALSGNTPPHSIRNHNVHCFALGLFLLNYKVNTKTPIVLGSVFNVRALKEAHRILTFNYIPINCMIPLKIDIHIIIVNIFKNDPAVCLNKTCTNYYIQNAFATLSYTQLKEE